MEFKEGDIVTKKSGKPFQHGNKKARIFGFCTMIIPCAIHIKQIYSPTKIVDAVYLDNCSGKVRLSILKKDIKNV